MRNVIVVATTSDVSAPKLNEAAAHLERMLASRMDAMRTETHGCRLESAETSVSVVPESNSFESAVVLVLTATVTTYSKITGEDR